MRQETREQIKRLEAVLNGETVDGLKLNDPGLRYDWIINTLAILKGDASPLNNRSDGSHIRV